MRRLSSILPALALSGCFVWTSAKQGESLRTDVDSQGTRLSKVEQAQNDQLEQLRKAEAHAEKSRAELEEVIERATTVVQRNSADVTVTVSELQTKLALLEGRLAELEHTLEQGGSRPAQGTPGTTGTVEAPPAETIPADKTEHYAAAYKAFSARNFNQSRALFRAYLERYASDAQADNAQYWIGASYLVENRPATALAELRKVIENHRGGDAIDEALLDMAEAFYRLRACSDAKTTLDTLIKTQASSPLAEKAKQKLKDLKKAPKDYCTS